MKIIIMLYAIQLLALLVVFPWGLIQRSHYYDFVEKTNKLNCSLWGLKNFGETWKIFDEEMFFISLIPLFGFLPIAMAIYTFYDDAEIIKDIKNEIPKMEHEIQLKTLFEKLPPDLNTRKCIIDNKVEALNQLNYHVSLVEEIYKPLKDLITSSFINDFVSEESINLLDETFREFEAFLDKLLLTQKTDKDKEYQECQKSINENFLKYREVLHTITNDLETRKGVF